ncbi:MAG: serine hydrolase domain-containing protein [Gemmataceae bacterium]
MRLRFVAIVVLLIGYSVRAEDPMAAVETVLQKRFPANKPGAAVLILKKGEPLLMKGYGLADIAAKTPITPDSAFDMASVSKQFTAMAVMQLAERGQLGYDDEVRKWIPELPEFEAPRPIKIRDLLNQTSGLTDYLVFWKDSDEEFARLRNADLPALFRGKKLQFDPGTKFDYSNSNYALLPLIVERASGKCLASWLSTNVFCPLEMTSSRVMDDPKIEIRNRVTGYSQALLSRKFELSRRDGPVCGDGNVFTTVRDLAKWDAGLAANKLVRAETLELAYTPVNVPDFKTGKNSNYGFGWDVAKAKDGSKIVWHNGGWAGTRTSISRFLADGLTIAVLCNNEDADADDVAMAVAKILRKPAE